MSDAVINQPDLRMTRNQFQNFVGEDDPQAIRVLERQLSYVNELYRKPSINLVRSDNFSIAPPLSTDIPIPFDIVTYSNEMEVDTVDASIIRFLQAGRYRMSFQVNLLVDLGGVTGTPIVRAFPEINGALVGAEIGRQFVGNGTATGFYDFLTMSAYFIDIQPQDELVLYLNFNGTGSPTLSISNPIGNVGATVFIERVF